MCGCSNFSGDSEYDNFLTKKSRERRKLRKKLRSEGMSSSEARTMAKEQIPRDKLLEVLNNLKANRVDEEGAELAKTGALPESEPERESEVLGLLAKLEGYGSGGTLTDAEKKAFEDKLVAEGAIKTENLPENTEDDPIPEDTAKSKMGLYIGIGAVVLIGGYFLMKRFRG